MPPCKWGNKNISFTYIIPFHKFVSPSQALRNGHRLELQRMNSRLCPCHWLVHSSRRTAGLGMSHFPLFCSQVSSAPVVFCSKAGWRKPTTAARMSYPQWRQQWRVSALESGGGRRKRSGPEAPDCWLTDWATCSRGGDDRGKRERKGLTEG